MSEEFEKNVILDPASEDGQKMAEDYINAPYATGTFPTLKYTADQLNNIATLASDIYSYVEGQYAHWVVDGGIEEEWDAYLDQLEQMPDSTFSFDGLELDYFKDIYVDVSHNFEIVNGLRLWTGLSMHWRYTKSTPEV